MWYHCNFTAVLKLHSVGFFQVKVYFKCALKCEKFGSHFISCQSLLLSTNVPNDRGVNCLCKHAGQKEMKILKEFEDPALKSLAKELPVTVMSSHASSTTCKYLWAFWHWKEWVNSHKLPSMPAVAHHISLYLQRLVKTTMSKATAEEAVYAIAWAHYLAGLSSPTWGCPHTLLWPHCGWQHGKNSDS